MEGKIGTPAALNGDVRTIPLIDKSLSIEGACADAKATGKQFASHAVMIEGHSMRIADNAAAIQTLRAENGVQDTTLGEHKALIDGNAKKIAANENSIGELSRKISDAENTIVDLQYAASAIEGTLADNDERILQNASDINETFNIVTGEVKPDLAKAQNDIEVLKNKAADIEAAMAADKETLQQGLEVKVFDLDAATGKVVTVNPNHYVRCLNFCTITFDFDIQEAILPGETIFGGLPKPAAITRVVAFNGITGDVYPLRLYADGDYGVIQGTTVNLPVGAGLIGSISYIVAADSIV